MKNTALIAAGGSGNRMEAKIKKQYLKVAGQPMLTRTVLFFNNNSLTDEIIIVVPKEDMEYCQRQIVDTITPKKPIKLVTGGSNRAESVYNGIKEIDFGPNDIVMIHDGARPIITDSLIKRLVDFLKGNPDEKAVIPVIPVKDTIKVVEQGIVTKTHPRRSLYSAQTPQCFRVSAIMGLFTKIEDRLEQFTDDSSIGEYFNLKINTVIGEESNIKITTPQDMVFAEILIGEGEECLK